MFEEKLKADLEEIFGLSMGATFDAPNPEKLEQERLFVQVDLARNDVKDTEVKSRVEGRLLVFGQREKLPFDYFDKRIAKADPSLTKNFFFFDITSSSGTLGNLCERTASFIYFYSGQYDPDKGSIDEVDIDIEFT